MNGWLFIAATAVALWALWGFLQFVLDVLDIYLDHYRAAREREVLSANRERGSSAS